MEEFSVPEGHTFPRIGEGAGFTLAGFAACLTGNKSTQFTEIRSVCGFQDDDDLMEVVLNPNVVTRIWFFQAASTYIQKGEEHWTVK